MNSQLNSHEINLSPPILIREILLEHGVSDLASTSAYTALLNNNYLCIINPPSRLKRALQRTFDFIQLYKANSSDQIDIFTATNEAIHDKSHVFILECAQESNDKYANVVPFKPFLDNSVITFIELHSEASTSGKEQSITKSYFYKASNRKEESLFLNPIIF